MRIESAMAEAHAMQKSSQDHHPGGLSSHQAAVHCQGQITQGRERERERGRRWLGAGRRVSGRRPLGRRRHGRRVRGSPARWGQRWRARRTSGLRQAGIRQCRGRRREPRGEVPCWGRAAGLPVQPMHFDPSRRPSRRHFLPCPLSTLPFSRPLSFSLSLPRQATKVKEKVKEKVKGESEGESEGRK